MEMDRIVSGSYDNAIIVWAFMTGHQLFTLTGHSNRVFRVQFDLYKIVSSSQDDSIRVWDMAGPKVVGSGAEMGGGGGRRAIRNVHPYPAF
jgi:WD40 repeat protein